MHIPLWCRSLSQFSSVANATYPEAYEKFLKAVDVVNLDLGWMVSAGCLWTGIDFHDRLLFGTLGPLVILGLLAATYTVAMYRARAVSNEAIQSRVGNVHMSAVLLLTFLVYSSVSSAVFRMFACETLDDGNSYLRADYRILCTDDKHRALQVYASVMIVVYPVGIPLFYAVLLYRLRGVLAMGGDVRSTNSRAQTAAGLWAPYQPTVFYYEVCHSPN